MINRDWEKFGEDIRKTVQDAIDAQDFGKLNQTITDTINNAVDSVSRNIRNAQQNQQWGRGPVDRRCGSLIQRNTIHMLRMRISRGLQANGWN